MYKLKPCEQCSKEHKNPKFCSQSCSIRYSNQHKNQRFLKRKCKNCQQPIYSSHTYCAGCWNKQNNNDMTLEEACKGRTDANKYMKVRSRAKSIAKQNNLLDKCYNCGYNKHVECCHIKDISEFTKDSLLSIINSKNNLIGLCPNCHWEFDNDLLQIG